MADIALRQPGVTNAVQFPGCRSSGFVNGAERRDVFLSLAPFDQRRSKDQYGLAIPPGPLRPKVAVIQDAFVAVFPAPARQAARHDRRVPN